MPDKKPKVMEFKFRVDSVDEVEGKFAGYASVWDVVDSYGDAVAKGAFRKTLKENDSFPMLWSHDIMSPIGIIKGREDKTGLIVEGQLNLDVQRAKEVRSLMKQGAINGLSIGYQTMKEDVDRENGTRILKEIKLWEISPCVFQACPGAEISEVKTDDLDNTDTNALRGEPDASTPAEEPRDTSKPEVDGRHLQDEAKATADAISKLIGGMIDSRGNR